VECDEIVAKNIPDFGLEDNIVFSTDYPHLDVKFPHGGKFSEVAVQRSNDKEIPLG
jgi:hypothetical protein